MLTWMVLSSSENVTMQMNVCSDSFDFLTHLSTHPNASTITANTNTSTQHQQVRLGGCEAHVVSSVSKTAHFVREVVFPSVDAHRQCGCVVLLIWRSCLNRGGCVRWTSWVRLKFVTCVRSTSECSAEGHSEQTGNWGLHSAWWFEDASSGIK